MFQPEEQQQSHVQVQTAQHAIQLPLNAILNREVLEQFLHPNPL